MARDKEALLAWTGRFWPPVVSALLLLLAFPPFNLGLLSLVALTPWIVFLRSSNGRRGWRSGYLFGVVYGIGQLAWLGQFVGRWTNSLLMGFLPAVAAVAAYAVYFGLAGWLMADCFRKDRAWLVPLVWAGVEVFRSYIPVFAFPWGLLASPLWPYQPLNQSAYFGSIYLVSAWSVAISTALAMLLAGESLVRVRVLGQAILVGVALSLLRLSIAGDTEPFPATVVQPGVDMAFGDQATEPERLGKAIQPLLDQAADNGSRIAVLPEGVADARLEPPTTPFRLPAGLPVLFGAQRSTNPSYQSYYVAEGGGFRAVDKTRLVIFGEFVPGRGVIPYPESFRLPNGDLSAGTRGVQSLEVQGVLVGPVICFEALFPDIAFRQTLQGARLLVVPSIDDWYRGTNAPDQLKAASVWRSIETGTPLLRSASTGYSLATDDHGRILAEAPLGETVGMRVEVPLPKAPSGFRLLPVFPLCSLIAMLYAVLRTFTSTK